MESLIQADIFFFVTTIMVVLVGVAMAFVLVRLAGILKNVRDISDEAKEEAARIVADVAELRQELKEHGKKFSGVVGTVESFLPKTKKVAKSKNR